MRYQNRKTGAIWHELSQSAGFLDWQGVYPYMFVHLDVSFDFLNTIRDYVETTGDAELAREHWDSIRAAYEYCRSTIPAAGVLPEIPAGQQGRDEQDPQRDELSLSLAWVSASESFAKLAQLTSHDSLAVAASAASVRARAAIRPSYYNTPSHSWVSGHLRSGVPVEGLTGSLTALLHHGLLSDAEKRTLLDQLASPAYRAMWGTRSTPNSSPLYDPDSYARGSVWALGTADVAMAFYEGERDAQGTAIWRDLVPWLSLDAPGHMHEVLRGDVFAPERESVPDQTWSSAASISSAVRGMLGLRVDAEKRELRFAPRLPQEWDTLRVQRINVAGADVSLALARSRDVVQLDIENPGLPMTLAFSMPSTGPRVRRVDATGGARLTSASIPVPGSDVVVHCASRDTCRVALRLAGPH